MYEHPSYIYNAYAVEQQRIDRDNERRRMITEHPERIVRTERGLMARVRGWFGGRRADAATSAPASKESTRPHCDSPGRPAPAQ